jgi:nitrogen regulatory protein PII
VKGDAKVADIELICAIVNYGLGSKVVKVAKECGIEGGTITLGKGTVNNRILEFLGLSDVRKEVVCMIGDEVIATRALEALNQEFAFHKPNHGIAFTTSICSVAGKRSYSGCGGTTEKRGEGSTMYQAIVTIVDKGKAEDVIDAATKAGSKGGTIINGRGSGIHETSKVFSMDIEPEKEIVLILSEVGTTDAIVAAIKEELQIEEPGKGIMFVQDVNRAYGLFK